MIDKQPVHPYNKIAPWYDLMMNHVDYEMWAKYIHSIFKYYQLGISSLADLSCGTGSLAQYISVKKQRPVASDLSVDMLYQFKGKKIENWDKLLCCDFTALPFRNMSFDAILVLYDSVNYLTDDTTIIPFLNQVDAVLKENGALIFDVVTPYICEKAFADFHEKQIENGNGYERNSWFIGTDNTQYTEFIVYENGQAYVEMHQQKIRPLDEWMDWIAKSPFELLGAISNFSFRKAGPSSERIHFILQKPA